MQPAKILLAASLPGRQGARKWRDRTEKGKGEKPKEAATSTREADDRLLVQPSWQPVAAQPVTIVSYTQFFFKYQKQACHPGGTAMETGKPRVQLEQAYQNGTHPKENLINLRRPPTMK